MTSRQNIGVPPNEPTGQRPDVRYDPSTLVRTARFAARPLPGAADPIVDLTKLYATALTTLGGERQRWQDILERSTVVILIDANRMELERSEAEIGWVRERIDPVVDLVLIWPGQTLSRPQALPDLRGVRLYLDVWGEFQRVVSPTGKRVALLVDPETGSIDRLSEASPVFAIERSTYSQGHRGTDRMIDLGDVLH